MTPLRTVFMGTAELACASLAALCQAPFATVVSVVTQPDRPKGRDLKLQPSPVKQSAVRHGLPVLQPERARNADFLLQVRDLAPDLIVVAAYGQILPQAILDLPRYGCLNVHASLLPCYRGAAPIQWAILDGQLETGVTIMKMDVGMDTGPILAQQATPIEPTDDAQNLHDRLAALGATLLVQTLPPYVAGAITPRPQPTEGATYARKITKDDGRLDWSLPAKALWNRVRAFTPWPGAFTFWRHAATPRLLKIWRAEVVPQAQAQPGVIAQADKGGVIVGCGQDALRIPTLQLEGSRRMAAQEFLAGHNLKPGDKLG